jgi:hypothetical protein
MIKGNNMKTDNLHPVFSNILQTILLNGVKNTPNEETNCNECGGKKIKNKTDEID